MDTVTVTGVELMAAGTWNASTGRTTVTPEDLASAVSAFNDGLVDKPQIKIGHTDPRFSTVGEDGNPALGWVANVHASADGTRLIGDLTSVPKTLAARLKDAFRHRSAEVKYGVRTAAGKTYRMVFTGLALLGAQPPAIKNLDDIHALYADSLFATGATYTGVASIFASGDTPGLQDLGDATPHSQDQQHVAPALGGTVEYPPDLLAALGLKAGATEVEVTAALTAATRLAQGMPVASPPLTAVPAPPVPTGDALPAGPAAVPATPAPTAASPAAPPVLVAAAAPPEGVMSIPVAMYERLLAGTVAAEDSAARLSTQRREALFSAAVHQTRIEPEDVATFSAIWDQPGGEQTVTKILTQLKPKVHTFSAGYTGDPNQPPAKDPRRPGEITDDDVKEQMAFIGLSYTGKGK